MSPQGIAVASALVQILEIAMVVVAACSEQAELATQLDGKVGRCLQGTEETSMVVRGP